MPRTFPASRHSCPVAGPRMTLRSVTMPWRMSMSIACIDMPGAAGFLAWRTNHGPTRLRAAARAAVVSSVRQWRQGRPTSVLNFPQNGHRHSMPPDIRVAAASVGRSGRVGGRVVVIGVPWPLGDSPPNRIRATGDTPMFDNPAM